jgi:para-nitrobenzyl esterase
MTKLSARLAALILAFGLASAASAALAAPASTPVVATRSGPVQGLVKDGTWQFLGLPFAKPPLGPLRWRPPESPAPWTAVRQATAFGPSCPQGHDIGDFAKPSETEDCLYLNVYAPARPSKAPRAVMVWFPGGALFAGAADDYDGSKLARRGDVVLVTLNYRIGVLGFFAHPAIDAEGHVGGNYGIQDQQAALRWVRDNIARFGGDPQRVTIFGQSAGGTSVLANVLSRDSAGLFKYAINESGARLSVPTRADASKIGARFATDAGCANENLGQTAACLRGLSAKDIVRVQPGHFASLMVDGDTLADQPHLALRKGAFNRTPMLMGVAGDEQGFFLAVAQEKVGYAALTREGYLAYAKTNSGALLDEVLKVYPPGGLASPSLDDMALGQSIRGCAMRMLAGWLSSWEPTWTYSFDDRTVPNYLKPQPYPLGAYHTAEILYLFPGFHGGLGTPHPLNAAQEKLADRMVDTWATFAKTGNPNLGGAANWPTYDAKRDNVQSLDLPGFKTTVGYGERYHCALFDKIAGL